MTRRALLLAALTLISAPLRAQADQLDQLMALFAARRHGRASFIEQQFLHVLKRPVESRGELIYDAPNHLEKRTIEPRVETLTIDGDSLITERGGHRHVVNLRDYPQIQPFAAALCATLGGDRAQLQRSFHLDLSGDVNRWTLSLTPLEARAASLVREIAISGAGDDLLRVDILQADGDRSLMTLRPFTDR